ncbi:hypothetical protein [Variovorax ginsengisoli]|uniref:Uncharacterized protein n=1 Tax=Variovorax ginsengisoli TaxID=363844 RepID=A0ABT8RZB8_9BURK|nr:hypothetical protein [Variovorax ginsengisoli]MDN8612750.1 hypothetical protein [Variovorax ginsengisoli]MDO1531920.1 hypothetical protein [Variovorax ginsengisoli]
MNAVHRMHAGHWSDRPEVDTRVSVAEQEDHQAYVGDPSLWTVVLLCLSPLLVPCVVSLVAVLLRT